MLYAIHDSQITVVPIELITELTEISSANELPIHLYLWFPDFLLKEKKN